MIEMKKAMFLLACFALPALAGCWDTYDRNDRVKEKQPPTYTNVGWNDEDRNAKGTSEDDDASEADGAPEDE